MFDRRRGFRAARRFALLGCVVLAGACSGGGGGGGPGGAPAGARFAYAANVVSNDISAYTVNTATGALTRIDCGAGPGCNGANFAAGTNPRSVRGTPNGKFLYVANQGSGDVSAYAVGATGMLSRIDCGGGPGCNGTNFAAGNSPSSLTVDPGGMYVYVANRSAIVAFAINGATGTLLRLGCSTGCSGSDFAAGSDPFAVAADPMGRFLYVANLDIGNLNGSVSAFRLNPVTGALGKVACVGGAGICNSSDFDSGVAPIAVAVDPSGSFVHVATQTSITSGTVPSVAAFSINAADGALLRTRCAGLGFGAACSAGIPDNFAVGGNPGALGVAPSGKFVYVASTTGVSAYDLLPDSSLDRIDCGGGPGCSGMDFAAGVNPADIAFDSAGGFAYVANRTSNDVTVFAVSAASGILTRVDCGAGPGCNGTDFAAGSGAFAVTIVGG